jgi:hypothetical protein
VRVLPFQALPEVAQMQNYPVDLEARQVVDWVLAELQHTPSAFKVRATRAAEVREIPLKSELHLGEVEREDLSEVAIIATLEIAPARPGDGWLLRIVVEDETGPRLPDRSAILQGEEQIGPGIFYHDFIRPGRGIADVIAGIEGPTGEAHLTRLAEMIQTNRHTPAVRRQYP